MCEMKNTIDVINGWLEIAGEKISELEDIYKGNKSYQKLDKVRKENFKNITEYQRTLRNLIYM